MTARLFALVLSGLLAFLPALLCAGPTTALENQLDWIEMNFWPRLLTRSPLLSPKLERFLTECRTVQSAAKVKVNLTSQAMTLRQITTSTTVRLRGFNIAFKRTSVADFYATRKYSSDGNQKKSRQLDLDQYKAFLEETANSNLEQFKRRYEDQNQSGTKNRRNVSNKLNRSQFSQIYGKMEIYFQTIQALRMDILKLRLSSAQEDKKTQSKKQDTTSQTQR